MVCGDFGHFANAENILTQCSRFLLSEDEAKAIISTMTEQVRTTWHGVARSQGVSERDAGIIKDAFVYPGFGRRAPPA
jgi:serine/threonine-protein kinase HipA